MSESSLLYYKIIKCLEKYRCNHVNTEPSWGCIDCCNLNYIFDSEESGLLDDSFSWMKSQDQEIEDLQSQLAAEQEKVRKLKEALLSPKKDMRFITVLDAIEWKKFVDKTLKEVDVA